MAAWLSGLLLLAVSVALGEGSCSGFQLMTGYGLEDVERLPMGVKVLETPEVDLDEECWDLCCAKSECDLALLTGPDSQCHLLSCSFNDLNVCDLKEVEGARSYRKNTALPKPTQSDFCLPQSETGRCRARFIRWWYDSESKMCKNFTYGGCNGNLNNHLEEEDCVKKCNGTTVMEQSNDTQPPNKRMVEADTLEISVPLPEEVKAPRPGSFEEYCLAPKFIGPCRAAFPRWYYDSATASCTKFTFGGCKPNKNNYLTEAECTSSCLETPGSHGGHRSAAAVALPILLAVMAGILLCAIVVFFVKMAKKGQRDTDFRAMWNPIDDKECLMNNAYTL
ncbi:kunitz-type protease inhibitor 2 [Pelodytes ibericus]